MFYKALIILTWEKSIPHYLKRYKLKWKQKVTTMLQANILQIQLPSSFAKFCFQLLHMQICVK